MDRGIEFFLKIRTNKLQWERQRIKQIPTTVRLIAGMKFMTRSFLFKMIHITKSFMTRMFLLTKKIIKRCILQQIPPPPSTL